MLAFKNLTLRNFLSTGNATQTVRFDNAPLTLILGQNLDAGGRNGAGKSVLLQALSYVHFGKPLTHIKAENLINVVNGKGLFVTSEFECQGKRYRIERGRKPSVMRYYVNDLLIDSRGEDEAQGENVKTQQEIDRVLGMTHAMFKQIVTLSTFSEPFLCMRAADQRSLIEDLLGITQISAKAEALKELAKGTKETIRDEEFRIKTVGESNQKIQNTINDLELKSRTWAAQRERLLDGLRHQLDELLGIDVDAEIAAHAALVEWKEARLALDSRRRELTLHLRSADAELRQVRSGLQQAEHDESHWRTNTCPTCGQGVQGTLADVQRYHDTVVRVSVFKEQVERASENCEIWRQAITECEGMQIAGDPPSTYYVDVAQAYAHRNTIATVQERLAREMAQVNPYTDQIDTLRHEGLQPIDYDAVNALNLLLKHQEFLVKLLTSKDSFVRKRIIDQNLAYLNQRLAHYLARLGLPHAVRFKNDLTVEINLLGRDFDFEQLSRGEMNRLIIATAFAFRDIWESLNQPVNLMLLDENLDNGTDALGIESAVELLKGMARQGRRVFVISHKEELVGRAMSVLVARKENGFTRYLEDAEAA